MKARLRATLTFMFFACLLLCVAATQVPVSAQTVEIEHLDAGDFPQMRAILNMVDAQERVVDAERGTVLQLLENGLAVQEYEVAPSAGSRSDSLSFLICVEATFLDDPATKVLIRQVLAEVTQLPTAGIAEFSLGVFLEDFLIAQDYTTDPNRILTKLDELENWRLDVPARTNVAAYGQPFGFVRQIGAARYARRVITISSTALTNGLGESTAASLLERGDQFYYVHLLPDGRAQVRTSQAEVMLNRQLQAQPFGRAMRNIMLHGLDSRRFELKWTSTARCAGLQEVEVSSRQFRQPAATTYKVTAEQLPRLEYLPRSVDFGFVPRGEFRDTVISGTALGAPLRFDVPVSSNAEFEIIALMPERRTLEPGETVEFTIRYRPGGAAYSTGTVQYLTSLCSEVNIECAGGDRLQSSEGGLVLEAPQEGELLGEHHLYPIRWSGVATNTPVRLEFSTDAGQSWALISDLARGGQYDWLVPALNGSALQVRASLYQANATTGTPAYQTIQAVSPTTLAVSPSGDLMANANNPGSIDIFEVQTGRLLRTLRFPFAQIPRVLDWHPDGKSLVFNINGRDLALLNVQSGAFQHFKDVGATTIQDISWSPTGNLLAAIDWNGSIVIWNYRTQKILRSSTFGSEEFYAKVGWTASENHVVIVRSDNRVVAWPWESAAIRPFIISELGSQFRDVAGGDFGETVALLQTNGAVQVLEIDDPDAGRLVVAEATRARYFEWDQQSNVFFLASSSSADIELWSGESGLRLSTIEAGTDLRALRLSRNGRTLLWLRSARNALEEIVAYDLKSDAEAGRVESGNIRSFSANWNSDGSELEIGDGGAPLAWRAADESTQVIDGLQDLSLLEFERDAATGSLAAFTVGRELGIYGADGTLRASEQVGWEGRNARWRPDRDQISCSRGQDVLLLDGPSDAIVRQRSFERSIADYDWEKRGGRRAAVVTFSNQLFVWDADADQVEEFEVFGSLREPSLRSVAWHPTQARVAVAADVDYVAIVDLSSGDIERLYIAKRANENSVVVSMDWTADGTRLAVAFSNLVIRIFDFDTAADLSLELESLSFIDQVSWHPDGERLLMRPGIGKLEVWDTRYTRSQAESVTVNLRSAEAEIEFLDGLAEESQVFFALNAYQNPRIINRGARPFTFFGVNNSMLEWREAFRQVGTWESNVTIPAGDSLVLPIELFPTQAGVYERDLHVIIGDTSVSAQLSGVGLDNQVRTSNLLLDMGSVIVGGDPRDAVLSDFLVNEASAPRTLTNIWIAGPHSQWFEIVANPRGQVLAAGESLDLNMRFVPRIAGINNVLVFFEIDGTLDRHEVLVYARAIPAQLDIADFSAAVGETTAARLSFVNLEEMLTAGLPARACRVELEYNASVLVPAERVDATSSPGEHRVRAAFDMAWDGTSSILGDVAFRAALGHVEQSAVRISGFTWLNGFAASAFDEVEGGSALFTLENLCRVDGTRLFDPFGAVPEVRVLPNPVVDNAEIAFVSIERGLVEFEIFDRSGQTVRSLLRQIVAPGAYRINVDLSELANGVYLIRMRSLNIERFASLVILR